MQIHLQQSKLNKNKGFIVISGSKSESNRLLLLQALFPQIKIDNLSNSDDSVVMQKALRSDTNVIDIHHAGTAMRFLTAYYSMQENSEVILTGSNRMKERPIYVLVNALRDLGANIEYLENVGFPPLKIIGTKLTKNKVSLKANVSSQYITALLLIGSKLENGLKLTLEGEVTSLPYIEMTLTLLHEVGIKAIFIDQDITVYPEMDMLKPTTITVESDWSSASYFYSIIALSELRTEISLTSFKEHSKQGDSILIEIYKQFGVTSILKDNILTIKKSSEEFSSVNLNLIQSPDIAQTIAVTAFGLGIECNLNGLHTLKIKETDRLIALKTEIEKLGGTVNITDDSLYLQARKTNFCYTEIDTYNDHRMAMAFAPLALKTPLIINDSEVVSKSYPNFWKDLKSIGFQLSQ